MSAAVPPTIAVVLPPREGFGPRRSRGIGLTVRQHSLATTGHRTVVYGGRQTGPVFLDVTFRLVKSPFYAPAPLRTRYVLGLLRPLRMLRPVLIEVHADPLIALWLQRMFPTVPVVLVLHDEPEASRLTRTPSRRGRLFNRLARIVTVSGWLRDQYLDGVNPPPARPPIVVPPSVDVANLPQSVNGLDTAGIPVARRRTRLVLFVGRLIPEKGPDQFIAACTTALPSLPGWRAEIIGAAEHMAKSPETTFVRLLQATAEPAGVAMMGYRDHPDVMAAMARAAIVVIPGGEPDPSGRVALEAMANGAAVICTAGGSLPEICGDAAIYVDPAQPGALADAIRALGGDPPRLAALGEAGRLRATQFDQPKIGRLMDAARARIIAEGPPTS
jgi:UDP-glucose:(glucosyl)LPS alpha-1,2-glucosyltransferase